MENFFKTLGYVSVGLTLIFLLVRIGYWISANRFRRSAARLTKAQNISLFTPNYTKDEISESLSTYINPDCGQADPSHESDFRHIADIREPIFEALDRFLSHADRKRHILILADSGMGKTSFCINYYNYKRSHMDFFTAIISLSRPNSDKYISDIKNPSSTVLILDALDEDAAALDGAEDRIADLLSKSADFKSVIITCRSQFFRDARSIPKDTGVSVITPRKRSAARTYTLHHLYLMPFSDSQIDQYINKQFPIWNIRNIKRRGLARELVKRVPELSGRPMLLELVPDLIRDESTSKELYDLYSYLVEGWLKREADWISSEKLREVSKDLAVEIHTLSSKGLGDRITRNRLNEIALNVDSAISKWEHLSTRSLLNRDNDGLIKFAHRSVMEYFFVLAAIDGDVRCLDLRWTDVMRDLLVSWGYTQSGVERLSDARRLLKSDLGRTSLIPLSDPPAEPGFVTSTDFQLATERRSSRSGARRIVSRHWRADSLSCQTQSHGLTIVDVECDLEWLLPFAGGDVDAETAGQFQTTVAIHKNAASEQNFRDPSYEELITLVEGLEASGNLQALVLGNLYFIGDVTGERTQLLVEIFSDKPRHNHLRCIDYSRQIYASEHKISVYELSLYRDVEEFHRVKAFPIYVRNLPD